MIFLVQRILNVQYSIPDYIYISPECRHLISRIFVADPAKVSVTFQTGIFLFNPIFKKKK